MRRIRSESWTFIWQPKVLMQAVLPEPGLPEAAGPAGRGLEASGTGAGARGVSLILFLRFVDPGPHGDLTGPGLDLQIFYLHVPGPSGPPQYMRDLRLFLAAKREQSPPT